MTEEQVTKSILKWLIDNDWKIVCFDFPQSGTGHFLHPNGSTEKNKDAINPDIVAVNGNICVFFENKNRFYLPDYEKQNKLIVDNNYTNAINELLKKYSVDDIYYGIGLPSSKYNNAAMQKRNLVDFILGVSEQGFVDILYDNHGIL